MSKNTLEDLFKNLEDNFDVETPEGGHKARFLDKINKQDEQVISITASKKKNIWKPLMGIAASFALLIALFIGGTQDDDSSRDLANVSPEMAETQDFFTSTINEELNKLKEESSPEVENLIQDALMQIELLEKNYESLKNDLIESGDDKRVIYAMISNFQNRIDILQNTLEKIENVKQLKNSSNETSITI